MYPSPEIVREFPFLTLVGSFANILFYLAVIWVFGRMGDNVNKIRKMLEQELKRRKEE